MSDDFPDLEPVDLEPVDPVSGDPAAWPPGWYTDPWSAGQYRRWNGDAWTAETRQAGPVATATPAAFPPSPGYPPAYPAARNRSGRTGATVAALVAIVLVAGAVGYALEASTESNDAANGSRSPATTTPGSIAPVPAAGDRSALAGLVVRQSDIGSARAVVLIPNGNRTTEPTLDLCNGTFPSEKQRVARLQVAELAPSGRAVLSTEAVTYKRTAVGTQAFAELRKVRSTCPHAPVTSPVGGGTAETAFNAAPDGGWPRTKSVERLAYSFTTTSAGSTSPSIAVYLRRGRVLMGIYFPQPSGAQPAVDGKTSIKDIVGLFEARMARLPAKVVGDTT